MKPIRSRSRKADFRVAKQLAEELKQKPASRVPTGGLPMVQVKMTTTGPTIAAVDPPAKKGRKGRNFPGAERGRFAKKFPRLEGRGVQRMHPRVVNVSFDVTQEVAAALRALRDTGLWGNGVDCASVAEELLRKALLDPQVVAYWQPQPFGSKNDRFVCRSCGHASAIWAARCPACRSIAGLEKRKTP